MEEVEETNGTVVENAPKRTQTTTVCEAV